MGGEQDTHRTSIDDQNKGFYELKKRKDKLQVVKVAIKSLNNNNIVISAVDEDVKIVHLIIFDMDSDLEGFFFYSPCNNIIRRYIT